MSSERSIIPPKESKSPLQQLIEINFLFSAVFPVESDYSTLSDQQKKHIDELLKKSTSEPNFVENLALVCDYISGSGPQKTILKSELFHQFMQFDSIQLSQLAELTNFLAREGIQADFSQLAAKAPYLNLNSLHSQLSPYLTLATIDRSDGGDAYSVSCKDQDTSHAVLEATFDVAKTTLKFLAPDNKDIPAASLVDPILTTLFSKYPLPKTVKELNLQIATPHQTAVLRGVLDYLQCHPQDFKKSHIDNITCSVQPESEDSKLLKRINQTREWLMAQRIQENAKLTPELAKVLKTCTLITMPSPLPNREPLVEGLRFNSKSDYEEAVKILDQYLAGINQSGNLRHHWSSLDRPNYSLFFVSDEALQSIVRLHREAAAQSLEETKSPKRKTSTTTSQRSMPDKKTMFFKPYETTPATTTPQFSDIAPALAQADIGRSSTPGVSFIAIPSQYDGERFSTLLNSYCGKPYFKPTSTPPGYENQNFIKFASNIHEAVRQLIGQARHVLKTPSFGASK
ncbi:MAG: hypothetical protein QM752_04075 [Gammaproteobacteria bacterium]